MNSGNEASRRSATLLPTVSFNALRRARTTLEDFTQSYFPYHGLKLPDDWWAHMDVLTWLEATIYALDEENEDIVASCSAASSPSLHLVSCVRDVLSELSLWDDRVAAELQSGMEFWEMERTLCCEMARAAQHGGGDVSFDVHALHDASARKSFDYRLLHSVLHKMVGAPYNNALMEFLNVDEQLVDIGDDLVDYEDDVLRNAFNIFRGYVHLYGKQAPIKLVARIGELESRHAVLLAALPQHTQQLYWSRHHAASAVPGSEKWSFPPVILDELAYREAHSDSSP